MRAQQSPPFFPEQWDNDGDANATSPDGQVVPPGHHAYMRGITLRDFFAAKALAAMLANPDKEGANRGRKGVQLFAGYAYEYADAMLKARQP